MASAKGGPTAEVRDWARTERIAGRAAGPGVAADFWPQLTSFDKAVGDAEELPGGLLIGLGPALGEDQALRHLADVAGVESDQLAPAESAGESDQEQARSRVPANPGGSASIVRRRRSTVRGEACSGAVPWTRRIPAHTARIRRVVAREGQPPDGPGPQS